ASLGTAARPVAGLPGGPRLNLSLHPVGPGEEPALEVDVGPGRVDVGAWLAPTWLAEVASRRLSRQGCGLVVEVLDIDRPGDTALVTLLRWPTEGGAAAPAVATVPLRRQGGAWEVAADQVPSAGE